MVAEAIVLKAERRSSCGTRASRRLRSAGRVPGIVYGHGVENAAIAIPEKSLLEVLHSGARMLKLDLEGAEENVLVKEVQRDSLTDKIIHIDFARVSLDERVEVSVPVKLRGTPVGVKEGGIIDQPLRELDVECVATQIPEVLEVDVSSLEIGQSILVRDVSLPGGLRVLNEPELIVVSVLAPKEEEVAPAVEEAAAEPELLRPERKEEEAVEEETKKPAKEEKPSKGKEG